MTVIEFSNLTDNVKSYVEELKFMCWRVGLDYF